MNFAKARPLNCRLFAVLCDEMQADHRSPPLHSEVSWLLRGKVPKRLVELEEVRKFLQDSGSHLHHFLDKKWRALLSCLSDIFDKLNRLNTSLQDPNSRIFQFFLHSFGTHKKAKLLKSLCKSDRIEMFVSISKKNYEFEEIKPQVLTYLTNFENNLKCLFLDPTLFRHEEYQNQFAVTALRR
jgi:hypothetical protein